MHSAAMQQCSNGLANHPFLVLMLLINENLALQRGEVHAPGKWIR